MPDTLTWEEAQVQPETLSWEDAQPAVARSAFPRLSPAELGMAQAGIPAFDRPKTLGQAIGGALQSSPLSLIPPVRSEDPSTAGALAATQPFTGLPPEITAAAINEAKGFGEFATSAAGKLAIPAMVGSPFIRKGLSLLFGGQLALGAKKKISEAQSSQDVVEGLIEGATAPIVAAGALPRIKPTLLPRGRLAALAAVMEERAKPIEKGTEDASQISTPTEVHGDVRPQPIEGAGQVPVQEGRPGVQPQAEPPLQAGSPGILLKPEAAPVPAPPAAPVERVGLAGDIPVQKLQTAFQKFVSMQEMTPEEEALVERASKEQPQLYNRLAELYPVEVPGVEPIPEGKITSLGPSKEQLARREAVARKLAQALAEKGWGEAPPPAPVKFPSVQEILKSSDEDLKSTKTLYGNAEVAGLARSMTEDQLKQAEVIILQDRRAKAQKTEDLKKNLVDGKITPDQFFQQQLDLQMAYGKGKIFTDVFAFLERPMPKLPEPKPAAAPPPEQTPEQRAENSERFRQAMSPQASQELVDDLRKEGWTVSGVGQHGNLFDHFEIFYRGHKVSEADTAQLGWKKIMDGEVSSSPEEVEAIRKHQLELQTEFAKKYGPDWSGKDLSLEELASWKAAAKRPPAAASTPAEMPAGLATEPPGELKVQAKPFEKPSTAEPSLPRLATAFRRDDTITLEFDLATGHPPSAEAIERMFKEAGFNVAVTPYLPNELSIASGRAKFRIDGLDEEGKNSTEAAKAAYEKVFGTGEDIKSQTAIEKAMPFADRLSKSIRAAQVRQGTRPATTTQPALPPAETPAAPAPGTKAPPPSGKAPTVPTPPGATGSEISAPGVAKPGTMLGPGAAGAAGEIKPTGPRGTPEAPTYGPSARMLEARRLRGVIAPVEPGKGIGVEEAINRGRDLLAQGANPETLMGDMERTKRFNADDAAVLRAHGEDLEQAAYAAADKYGVVSPEYEKAWEADAAWSKRFKAVATEWHKVGQGLQGETEIDTGTFHGMRKAFFDATGKDFTPKQAEDATRIAKGVKDAADATDKAKKVLVTNLDKEAGKTPKNAPATGKQGERLPDAQTLWKRAKAMLDAGETDFDNIRHKLADEFGIPVDEVSRRLAQPRGAKQLTDEMYSKMSEQRRLVSQAKNWLKNQQIPGWLRFTRNVPRVFFVDKILGHGTVGMVTHAGINVFNPTAWKTYWPTFFQQYKLLASPAYHERMMQDLVRDPDYVKFKRAGAVIDPFRHQEDYNSAFSNLFHRIGLGGNRGFDSLKLFRLARCKQIWYSYPEKLRTSEMAQATAYDVNHATGVVGMHFREWANWTFFAPKLEGARWAWAVGDPLRAAKVFADWHNSTPEARAFAMGQVKEKAVVAGTYFGLLAVNQGLLQATNSDQEINYTNPRRADFLAFKIAGYNVGVVGPMLGMVRLLANLVHAAAGDRSQLESLDTRSSEFGKLGANYLRGKLSPFAGFGVDVVSQSDFQGRPMPYSDDQVPAYLRREGIEPYTYGEYAAQQFTPIPVSEAIREVWRDQGMGEEQIRTYLHALIVGLPTAFTGARVTQEIPH